MLLNRTVLLTLFVLLTVATVAQPAAARDVPELPRVCGEFYNWCEEALGPVYDVTREASRAACEKLADDPYCL